LTRFRIAVHAVIEAPDGRYLVLRRAPQNRYRPHCWDLPGGHIEPGETVEAALHREIAEETALQVTLAVPILTTTNLTQLPDRQTVQILYRCHPLPGEIRLEPTEHDRFAWITHLTDLADLADLTDLTQVMPYLAAFAAHRSHATHAHATHANATHANATPANATHANATHATDAI
jgi:8-oxo-dGTP pyrophosphatase MutT (NUDIX family)